MGFLQRTSHKKITNSRGDTIVEVLIAIAILGFVLGGAYVTANKNAQINQASQERLVGIKLAESQIERLRSAASGNVDLVYTYQNFCFDNAGVKQTATDGACLVNSLGATTTTEPAYRVSITKNTTPITGTSGLLLGYAYIIRVSWEDVSGDGTANVTYNYGVYQ